MKIAVVGVGGVGGYFGGRLAQAGHELYLVARGAHLAAIRAHGLHVESVLGDFTVQPAAATASPAELGPVDLVLVGVKTWQLADLAPTLVPLIGPQTMVLPLLNGVEAAPTLAASLGAEHVLGGLCRIIAAIVAPGLIRHSGVEPAILFGELDNQLSPRTIALRETLLAAGIHGEIPADIHAAIWQKFMLVCTWSGLGAITRVPIGAWRSLPGTRTLAMRVLEEVAALAVARGVALAPDTAATTLAYLDTVPAIGTASLQRDLMEGRPSELEAQTGAVVRLGAAMSLPTPVNAFIYHCLLPQEQRARESLNSVTPV